MWSKHHILVSEANNIIYELCEKTSFAAIGGIILEYLLFIITRCETKSGVRCMKENKLADMSMSFSVQIIDLVKELKSKHETIISNQIGRSGTSIGANIYEANYAQGPRDFISKLEIALKEASETGYWLDLLYRTHYIDETKYQSLNRLCTSIRVMLISSCRTAKKNHPAD